MSLRQANAHGSRRKPSLAIFCRSFEEGGDPFTSDYYWQAYQDLLFALRDRGIDAYFATDNNSYLGYGEFAAVYGADHKVKLSELPKVENVTVDLVFDRGGFIGRDVATINPAILQKIGSDKAETYRYFADYQPFTIICDNKAELLDAFSQIEGSKVVVKEPEGMGGKQVYIGTKQEVLAAVPATYPLLVQEFLDTSAGVSGKVAGVHDVRLSVCAGEFIGYYIRQAKPGSLHSNVSRGGTMVFFDVASIPKEVAEAALAIDETFAGMPRYYSIDFISTPKGWKMLEINPGLALLPLTDGEEARKTTMRLADYLAEACVAAAEAPRADDLVERDVVKAERYA